MTSLDINELTWSQRCEIMRRYWREPSNRKDHPRRRASSLVRNALRGCAPHEVRLSSLAHAHRIQNNEELVQNNLQTIRLPLPWAMSRSRYLYCAPAALCVKYKESHKGDSYRARNWIAVCRVREYRDAYNAQEQPSTQLTSKHNL